MDKTRVNHTGEIEPGRVLSLPSFLGEWMKGLQKRSAFCSINLLNQTVFLEIWIGKNI